MKGTGMREQSCSGATMLRQCPVPAAPEPQTIPSRVDRPAIGGIDHQVMSRKAREQDRKIASREQE
jgi:hypothetical protein